MLQKVANNHTEYMHACTLYKILCLLWLMELNAPA